MLTENKTSKYLLYAMGEILLVVIGILIALQVNNWNENKKSRKTEIGLLQELKGDLNATMADLVTDIDKAQLYYIFIDSLYKSMTVHKIKNKSTPLLIKSRFPNFPLLYPKLGAYEALQNYGINNISNDSLRSDITDFYQLELSRLNRIEQEARRLDKEEIKPYLREISEFTNNCKDCYSISDIVSKRVSPQISIQQPTEKLLQLTWNYYFQCFYLYQTYKRTATTIDNLLKGIDMELEKK